ncbi:hypothetical protein MGN70_012028 [Eutypa lata]|nr:hypothetical protein MGN70_012028 [Eutypa lata]
MSQYISTLNEVPQDVSPEESSTTLEEELAMFTNNNFVDWDSQQRNGNSNTSNGGNAQQQSSSAINLDLDGTTATTTPANPETSGPDALTGAEISSFDFNLGGDYGFGFDPYTPSSVQPFSDNIGSLPPIQPSPTFPRNGAQQRPYGAPTPQTGDKRKATEVPPPRAMSFEEQSRLAAEEDKRRRNTAASARFRVKKKAREQALEKSQKELNDKVTTLETRIQTLETENKWLRELVMEKNGGSEKVVTALLQQKDRNAGKGPKAKDEITAKTS